MTGADLLLRARQLRAALDEMTPELDRVRAELREAARQLAESGEHTPDEIQEATGLDPRMILSSELSSCCFCGLNQAQVPKLIAGPNANICGDCVERAISTDPTPGESCGFCEHTGPNLQNVYVGAASGHQICSECLALCCDILSEDLGQHK